MWGEGQIIPHLLLRHLFLYLSLKQLGLAIVGEKRLH